jgi:hypothetical protein
MLYSKNNGYPQPLPFRIVLPDNRTRTDPTTFSAEEISLAGYTPVSQPPQYAQNQVLVWTGVEWQVRDKTPDELDAEIAQQWQAVRQTRDQLLSHTDWRYLRHASESRLGLVTSDNIMQLDTYTQALRDVTKQPDPYAIVWPELGAPDGT